MDFNDFPDEPAGPRVSARRLPQLLRDLVPMAVLALGAIAASALIGAWMAGPILRLH